MTRSSNPCPQTNWRAGAAEHAGAARYAHADLVLTDDPRLSPLAKKLIADPANEILVSSASAWENLHQAPDRQAARLRRPRRQIFRDHRRGRLRLTAHRSPASIARRLLSVRAPGSVRPDARRAERIAVGAAAHERRGTARLSVPDSLVARLPLQASLRGHARACVEGKKKPGHAARVESTKGGGGGGDDSTIAKPMVQCKRRGPFRLRRTTNRWHIFDLAQGVSPRKIFSPREVEMLSPFSSRSVLRRSTNSAPTRPSGNRGESNPTLRSGRCSAQ